MGQFSVVHLILVVVVVLIFFGPSRLPQLGQSLGKAIKGFKDGINDVDSDSKLNEKHLAENNDPVKQTREKTKS